MPAPVVLDQTKLVTDEVALPPLLEPWVPELCVPELAPVPLVPLDSMAEVPVA